MKTLFLKQKYDCFGPWSSFNYTNTSPLEILNLHYSKGGHPYQFILLFEADVKIIEEVYRFKWIEDNLKRPEYAKAIEELTTGTQSVYSIDFSEYDFVYSSDPIIPQDIILKYPSTLFAYVSAEHWDKTSINSNSVYDLFLDHVFTSDGLIVGSAKISLKYPYTRCMTKVRNIFNCTKEDKIFMDYRTVMYYITKDSNIVLSVKEAEDFVNESSLKYNSNIVFNKGNAINPCMCGFPIIKGDSLNYMNLLASSKYFVSQVGRIGQSFQDAASVGCICIGSCHDSFLLHSKTRVKSFTSIEEIINLINIIEKDIALQKEIIEHQDRLLKSKYEMEAVNVIKQRLKR